MKSKNQINQLLTKFHSEYGIDLTSSSQGDSLWLASKLGVISASNASKVVAKTGSATRNGYMAELVGQVATGLHAEISGKAIEWGKNYEQAARSSYEFMTGNKIEEVPFVFKDSKFRVGVSPDGIVKGKSKGTEIKCPYNTRFYIEFLANDKIKPEYQWQYQFTLWVTGADEWDFVQFDPRMKISPMKIITVKRENKYIDKLEEQVPLFISEMDEMMNTVGVEFGQHWLGLSELIEGA